MMNKCKEHPARFPPSGRLALFVVLMLILLLVMSAAASAQDNSAFARQVGWIDSKDVNGDPEDEQDELAKRLPTQSVDLAVDTFVASVVQTIDTSQFDSADPTGITYLPSTNTLLISDADVDERYPGEPYAHPNLFEISLSGTLLSTSSTMAFTFEPEAVSLRPSDGHFFFVDDNEDRVFEMDPGVDEDYGTGDDIITSFSTAAFGSPKPLGVVYVSGLDTLFITDSTNAAVYKLMPGPNGVFDGVPPEGDDSETSFSTLDFGIDSPEGVVFNPTNGLLYICSKYVTNRVAVVNTDGTLAFIIDTSAANLDTASDLTLGPGSGDSSVTHLYITERGVEVWEDPDENDGKVYEMALPPNIAPTISDIPGQVVNEGTGTGALAFTVGDVETAAANLTVTGSSSNTTLVPNGNIVFGGSGANRTVTVTPAAQRNGTATITVTVRDLADSTASDSFVLTVTAVNDAPAISDIPDQVVQTGVPAGPVAFTVDDIDSPASSLSLTFATSNPTLVDPANGVTFGGSEKARTLVVTPKPGINDTAVVTVTVSDGDLEASAPFLLMVEPHRAFLPLIF